MTTQPERDLICMSTGHVLHWAGDSTNAVQPQPSRFVCGLCDREVIEVRPEDLAVGAIMAPKKLSVGTPSL